MPKGNPTYKFRSLTRSLSFWFLGECLFYCITL